MDKLLIKKNLQASIDLKQRILNDADTLNTINLITEKIIDCYKT